MVKSISITVKGRHKTWAFTFQGDPKHIAEWQADGLNVAEVYNTVPYWAQQLGLTRLWCRVQDAWQFLRLY